MIPILSKLSGDVYDPVLDHNWDEAEIQTHACSMA